MTVVGSSPRAKEAVASAFRAALFGVHGGSLRRRADPAGDHDGVARRMAAARARNRKLLITLTGSACRNPAQLYRSGLLSVV